jgi:hypothetical protein
VVVAVVIERRSGEIGDAHMGCRAPQPIVHGVS